MDEGSLGQWLTLDELASRAGRKATGLRTWAQRRRRDGRHRWRKNNAGQWTVEATPELLAELERGPGEGASLVASLTDEGAAEALDEARAEAANLREALSEARVSQAKAEATLKALERAHAAELTAVRELVTELRTSLAEPAL